MTKTGAPRNTFGNRRRFLAAVSAGLTAAAIGPLIAPGKAMAYIPCDQTRCTLYGVYTDEDCRVYAWYKCYDIHSNEFCGDMYYYLGS